MHTSPIRRRLAAAVGAVAVTAGAVALTASPASAHQVCRAAPGHVICLSTTPMANRDFAVHLGIDIHMSQADAQAIINAPGEELSAKIWADDPVYDNGLFSVPVTWSAAGEIGLSAEFDIVVDGEALDEDDGWFEGRLDEVYGVITLRDPRTGVVRSFTSPVESHYF